MAENKIRLYIDSNSTRRSDLQNVIGMPRLKWSVQSYRQNNSNKEKVTIKVVGGSAKVKVVIKRDGTNETWNMEQVFNDGDEHECKTPFSVNSAYYTFTATFGPVVTKLRSPRTYELVDNTKPHCFNAEIVVGNNRLKVHRGFLSMISPVFHAAFTHKTKEAETGIIEIKDFDFKTVKNAIEYLYGREVNTKSAVEIVDILRFVDKYNIDPAIAILEEWLNANLVIDTFAGIATYAWQYDRKNLQQECGRLYRKNLNAIALHPDFVKLEPTIMAGVIGAAFSAVNVNDTTDDEDF